MFEIKELSWKNNSAVTTGTMQNHLEVIHFIPPLNILPSSVELYRNHTILVDNLGPTSNYSVPPIKQSLLYLANLSFETAQKIASALDDSWMFLSRGFVIKQNDQSQALD